MSECTVKSANKKPKKIGKTIGFRKSRHSLASKTLGFLNFRRVRFLAADPWVSCFSALHMVVWAPFVAVVQKGIS